MDSEVAKGQMILRKVSNRIGCPGCGAALREGEKTCSECTEELASKVLLVEITSVYNNGDRKDKNTGRVWSMDVELAERLLRVNTKKNRLIMVPDHTVVSLSLPRE